MRDAPIKPKKVESASDMEQKSRDAVMKDAPTMCRREEFALDMEQSPKSTPADMMDAPMGP